MSNKCEALLFSHTPRRPGAEDAGGLADGRDPLQHGPDGRDHGGVVAVVDADDLVRASALVRQLAVDTDLRVRNF